MVSKTVTISASKDKIAVRNNLISQHKKRPSQQCEGFFYKWKMKHIQRREKRTQRFAEEGLLCPPLEGVNFEIITHSGFRGRIKIKNENSICIIFDL